MVTDRLMRSIQDIRPGRVVEIDGELHLIEEVHLTVTTQRIESLAKEIEKLWQMGEPQPCVNPVFHRFQGPLGDEVFSSENMKILHKKEEL